MADLILTNIYEIERFEAAGRTLIWLSGCFPPCLLRNTSLMRKLAYISSINSRPSGRDFRSDQRANKRLAQVLDFNDAQWNIPDISWDDRRGCRVPFVLATNEQIVAFETERWPMQVAPALVKQIDSLYRRGGRWKTLLPGNNKLSWWLRHSLLHSPAHWYTKRIGNCLQHDFSTFTRCIECESANCIYNVRDLTLTDDDELTINSLSSAKSVPKVKSSEADKDDRDFRHSAFLALVLTQAANQTSYHNWVHFYYNDLVVYQVQSHFRPGHWLRTLLDPHMRYQNCLNNSGFFSAAPNKPVFREAWDDVIFGGMLSCWTLGTFQENIIDKTLGYYVKERVSHAADETIGLEFNLNSMPKTASACLDKLLEKLRAAVYAFVSEVVDRSCPLSDKGATRPCKEYRLLALVTENILKYLHKDCLAGLPEPASEEEGIRTRFKLIVTRYIIQAGFLHGLEHYQMYFWFAPLLLPQRIRTMYDTSQDLSDYSFGIDMHNAYHGHEMFTRYYPNKDNKWNWSSLEYDFEDLDLKTSSRDFVKTVQRLIEQHDEEVYAPARKILEAQGIPFSSHCFLHPGVIPTSICL
eukprot:gb/GFBE01027779.1/.p1 GENE.gb/GFBE01027779.1/~~gb/GFBE01027779.1/.p1  ORF type:complete len:581 (+),score=82.36 gb/GFBE01027779.1/:1-1743(+)